MYIKGCCTLSCHWPLRLCLNWPISGVQQNAALGLVKFPGVKGQSWKKKLKVFISRPNAMLGWFYNENIAKWDAWTRHEPCATIQGGAGVISGRQPYDDWWQLLAAIAAGSWLVMARDKSLWADHYGSRQYYKSLRYDTFIFWLSFKILYKNFP